MKKVLFATSALVASAGIASADISLTGGGSVAISDTGAAGAQAQLQTDLDFNIVASVTSDTGITFGASADLDSANGTGGTALSDEEITMSGEFGTFTFGQVDNAAGIVGLADAGIEGIGLDDDLEAIDNVGAADIHYSNTFGNITLTLSYEMGQTGATAATDGDFGVGVSFSEGGFDVAAAYTSDQQGGGANDTATALQLGYTYGSATIGALFADNGTRSGSGFSLSYDMGDGLTITAVANQTDANGADTHDDQGVGFSYDMGNGVSFAGAIGSVNDNTAMDLGFGFSF